MDKVLLSFGHGYSAQALAPALLARGWTIFGTTRSSTKATAMADTKVCPLLFDDHSGLRRVLASATHVLVSAAPGAAGDPVLAQYGQDLADRAAALEWLGYLSTTGVY
ncbi:MAG: SDR family NAD(P)-dependent oxidoreductase, partial [Pseudomonadota bacterium]